MDDFALGLLLAVLLSIVMGLFWLAMSYGSVVGMWTLIITCFVAMIAWVAC